MHQARFRPQRDHRGALQLQPIAGNGRDFQAGVVLGASAWARPDNPGQAGVARVQGGHQVELILLAEAPLTNSEIVSRHEPEYATP